MMRERRRGERPDGRKFSHAQVRYRIVSESEEQCRRCAHFLPGGKGQPHCQIVKDPIYAGGWCVRYEEKSR
jgi:hypothetical protein